MSLIEKIPDMSDQEVVNLLANARRLSTSGSDKQKADAQELLPVLEETAAQRQAAKVEAAAAKRAALRKPKAKTAKAA